MDDATRIIELVTSVVKLACEVAAAIPIVRRRGRERRKGRKWKR